MTLSIDGKAAEQALADIERTEVAAFNAYVRRNEEAACIMIGSIALAWTIFNHLSWAVADTSLRATAVQIGLVAFGVAIALAIRRFWPRTRLDQQLMRRRTRPLYSFEADNVVWFFRLPLLFCVMLIVSLALIKAVPDQSPVRFVVQAVGFQTVFGAVIYRTPLSPLVFMVATTVVCGVLMWVPVGNQGYAAAYGLALVQLALGMMSRFATKRGWPFP